MGDKAWNDLKRRAEALLKDWRQAPSLFAEENPEVRMTIILGEDEDLGATRSICHHLSPGGPWRVEATSTGPVIARGRP